MNYLDEYVQLVNDLKNGKKTKIDISFIVPNPTKRVCVELNQTIGKEIIGDIRMGSESIIFPHISICMGFVDSYDMLREVFKVVDKYSQEIAQFNLDFDTIYEKGVSPDAPRYLFVDPIQDDFLMKQKDSLDELLKNVIYPIGWDMKGEPAHITVGCYKKLPSSYAELIDLKSTIPSCKISQIGVSIVGKRGVCLGLLKVFDLAETI